MASNTDIVDVDSVFSGGEGDTVHPSTPVLYPGTSTSHPFIKKKPPVMPDDYRKLRNKSAALEKKNQGQKWIQAQEMRRGILRPLRTNLGVKNATYNSHTYFNNLWGEAQLDLRSILKEEQERGTVSGTERKQMFTILCEVFYKYLVIFKKLDETYDQMAHPQKRILVRRVLEMIIARLLEIRGALVSTENSEFFYFDELCYSEKKITPPQLDVPVPKFYYHDPPDRLVLRDQWFAAIKERQAKEAAENLALENRIQAKINEGEGILKRDKSRTETATTSRRRAADDPFGLVMGSFEGDEYVDQAAIILIQTMERGRQGWMRYRLAKFLHDEEARALMKKHKAKKHQMELGKAVVIIQKIVRGFLARSTVRRMREEELELLGLCWTSPTNNDASIRGKIQRKCQRDQERLEGFKEERRKMRRLNQKVFEDAQISILNKLRLLEAPDMAEAFKFQLRTWMLDVKETIGKLPDIPKAEFGGSRFFICPNQLPDDDEIREKGKTVTDKKKKQDRKQDKKDKKEKKNKEKAGKTKMKASPGELAIPKLDPPTQMDDLVAASMEYNKVWRGRSEAHNLDQTHEEHFIIHEKRQLISEEVREQVDLALRAELQLLKQALENKKSKKAKKKGKGKKGKRGKGKKKKKGRKGGKDMTPDRTIESLFQELLDNDIIKEYPKIRLDSLVGTCSLINGEIRSFFGQNPGDVGRQNEERPMPGDANPLPSFGDVKRAVKDIAILPMGSSGVHSMSPHVKSLLICGPEGSGKKTLVNAICTELHATMFDLTAANIAGKYQGKPGLKMLMHLIEKVGAAISPVIIKIDNADKTYIKKVPKTDKTEPRRLKKQLGKMLKTFSPGDQTLVIGLSSEPWQCPFKLLKKDYQKIIYCPRPEYGSRADLWRNLLLPHSRFFHHDVHFSLLTKLSDGWSAGVIKKVVESVITTHIKLLAKDEHDKKYQEEDPLLMMETQGKKISSVGKRLIRINQFLEELSNYDPVFIEQDKAWHAWFSKTPLQKARLASQTGGGGGGAQTDKKKKTGKKKSKSKKKKK